MQGSRPLESLPDQTGGPGRQKAAQPFGMGFPSRCTKEPGNMFQCLPHGWIMVPGQIRHGHTGVISDTLPAPFFQQRHLFQQAHRLRHSLGRQHIIPILDGLQDFSWTVFLFLVVFLRKAHRDISFAFSIILKKRLLPKQQPLWQFSYRLSAKASRAVWACPKSRVIWSTPIFT